MAGSGSVDSKEELKADMSVDNVCYVKIPSKQGSGKNAAVELQNCKTNHKLCWLESNTLLLPIEVANHS